MKKKRTNSNNQLSLLSWLAWGIISASIFILSSENLEKALLIWGFLLIWVLVSRVIGTLKSSILLFLFVLPLNITITFPQLVDPYVAGVYVNYLVPIISILDIFALLALLSSLSDVGSLKKLLISLPKIFYLLPLYLVIHLLLHPDINSAVWLVRMTLYVLSIWSVLQKREELFDNKFLESVGKVLLASVLIQLTIGGIQFILGKSIGLGAIGESQLLSGALGTSTIKLSDGSFLRAYGTFPHPNVLAGYLLFTSIVSLYLYRIKKRQVYLATIVLAVFLLIFTFSRIAILLAIFAIIVLLLPSFANGLNILIFERFGTLFTGNDYSLGDRVALSKSAFRVISENLLNGSGAGNFAKQLATDIPYTGSGISLLQPVHNIFLLIIAEHGIIAGVGLTGLMFWYKIRQILATTGIVKTFRIVVFICILVIGMFDHYLLTLPQGISIFLISLFL